MKGTYKHTHTQHMGKSKPSKYIINKQQTAHGKTNETNTHVQTSLAQNQKATQTHGNTQQQQQQQTHTTHN